MVTRHTTSSSTWYLNACICGVPPTGLGTVVTQENQLPAEAWANGNNQLINQSNAVYTANIDSPMLDRVELGIMATSVGSGTAEVRRRYQ